ncbi:hypothetical protein N7476_006787 [Penicillium atrosanguineum]|uniref:Uncharacterized protein n=1 Tax=Penicillium atrosanguineum TaxID=1132637 RepID=A0A9W9PYE4_9EURO|nr:hypothetical protein N7526_010866 [Penicillium atrosanguineum]KAJ5316480.1 hypothetical protein N7476_006787 [Penicillium atrosanguineum]
MNLPGPDEYNFRHVKEESSRAKVLDYLKSREEAAKRTFSEQSATKLSEPGTPKKSGDRDQVESDSDSSADSIPDALEVQGQTIVDELQELEDVMFKTNAF